ncbi:MAG TPA: hypothetical protein VK786_04790 [bacterium]|jgi:hypothetical protein|nr:hypothetical protein [bacterium]
MGRKTLRTFGALLALTSLLVLNLHVLAHVFGVDHDDDGPARKGKPAAAPCALCQAVLAQTTLEAAPSVQAPLGPLCFRAVPADRPLVRKHFFAIASSTRGPPAHGFV